MVQYEVVEIHKNEYIKVLKYVDNIAHHEIRKKSNSKTVILIIPGNPGLIEYYENFAYYLHDQSGVSVIGLSHTGHLNGQSHGYNNWRAANYEQQINDKIHYIKNNLLNDPSETLDLILIGHSIGCHIILEILSAINERALNVRVKKSILLFPTIEKMSETPQGKIVTLLLNWFLYIILFTAYLLTSLPKHIIERIVRYSFNGRKNHHETDENAIRVSHEMISCFSCIKSILIMAKHEMRMVKELNIKTIESNLKKLVLYYGIADHWCPIEFYHGIKAKLSSNTNKNDLEKYLILDNCDIEHAFLLNKKNTKILSDMIIEWIQDCL